MDLIQKANKLGYKHYTEFTVEELDNLSLENSNKQIEYYFIQKWLREKHNVHIQILPYNHKYLISILKYGQNGSNPNFDEEYNTYEEALEIGLQEALELIKND